MTFLLNSLKIILSHKMSQKNSVEELLAELFTEESTHGTTEIKNMVVTDNLYSNESVSFIISKTNLQNLSDKDFYNFFRMNKQTIIDLQKEIDIDSSDTNLLLTLFILGNVTPLPELSTILNVSEKKLITVCKTYFEKILQLSDKYVSWPTISEMSTLERLFITNYNFPSVIGAIGCLHITVQIPESVPNISDYFNDSTGNYTIVLQAVCDSNLQFRDLFIGFPGSYNVQEILEASPLMTKLKDDGTLRKLRKHLLGGTEHPELETLLTPYPLTELDERQLKFNLRHSSAMLVIDRTFSEMENRFQRMKCLDCFDMKFATLALGAICVLHNYTRIKSDNVI